MFFLALTSFILGASVMFILKHPDRNDYRYFHASTLTVLWFAISTGTSVLHSKVDEEVEERVTAKVMIDSLKQTIKRLQGDVDRLQEPHVLAALQVDGCQHGAELYRKMMESDLIAKNRQAELCYELSLDAQQNEVCQRYYDACEAQRCLVEPHAGCTALRRAEDSRGYRELKAPATQAE